jgi:hypothetical protein
MIRDIEKVLKSPIERKTIQGFDYNVPPATDDKTRMHQRANGRQNNSPRQTIGMDFRNKRFNNRKPATAKAG